MARMVNCAKLGKELPGMDSPPYNSALGKRIYENVSQQGWEMWMQHSVILINHYGLSLGDPNARSFLMEQLEEFFFGEGAQMPEDWTPVGAGGKGTPMAAPRK